MHVLYNHYVLKCFYRSPSGPHKLGLSCHVVGEGLGLGFIHGVCANFGLVGPHPRAICERLRDRSHGPGDLVFLGLEHGLARFSEVNAAVLG